MEKLLPEYQRSSSLQVSGLVVASDGINGRSLLDVINTPFYGGLKIPLRHKILNPNFRLVGGTPLIEPAISAMFKASSVHDFVIVGNGDQCENLEEIALRNSNGKPYKVIPNIGNIGEAVELGADNIALSGYLFVTMPDLPYINGPAIDLAVAEILNVNHIGADAYLPIVSSDFVRVHGHGWASTFSRLQKDGKTDRYKGLNFFIVRSSTINPQVIERYYAIRAIHSLKGIINAARYFPVLLPEVALRYSVLGLSMALLEEKASLLYGGTVKIMEVSNPAYVAFLKDIDTLGDYQAYLSNLYRQGRTLKITS